VKLTTATTGYRQAHIRHGIDKTVCVHVLVAKAFIPNPEGYPMINHKNEFYQDNRVCNLEWCDYAYNNAYGTRSRRMGDTSSESVICIMPNGKEYWFRSLQNASRVLGIQQSNAWKVANGLRKHTCGYKFYKF
jgi:hypothetical protein